MYNDIKFYYLEWGLFYMADIREYRKLHNNLRMVKDGDNVLSQEIIDEGDRSTRRHWRRKIAAIVAIIFVIVLAIVLYNVVVEAIGYNNGYSIGWSMGREEGATAKYIEYGNGFLKYSNDGITYYGNDKKSIWNYTYTMRNPKISICGDKIAVADIDGTAITVYDQKGYMNSVDTALLISQVEVTKNGLVVAVLGDESANYITMFDTKGNRIYNIKTTLTGDGYPMDIAVTSDGTKLMASFLYVSGESMKTNVVFYNFSEIGQNETERLVGGFNHYDSMIVPEVAFLTDKKAIAIGENILSIYSMGEYPKLSSEIKIDNSINKIFYNSEYVGIVTNNLDGGSSYLLDVYNLSGKRKFSLAFDTEYSTMKFDDKGVIMYNSNKLTIANMSGHFLYDGPLDMQIENILTTGSRGKYMLVSSKYIQRIQFN